MDEIFIDEAVNELHTIRDVIRWTVSRLNSSDIFYGHGSDNALDEAIKLTLQSLFLPMDTPENIQTSRLTRCERYLVIKRVIRRINDRIPASYLTNKAWFCGMEFYIDERVLVPRSPIGELINNRFHSLLSSSPKYILDMCTGSGCLAIACSNAFPKAVVDAVDISIDALAVTERNIQAHGFQNKVIPIHSDLFCDVPCIQYDLIVTNPPYVNVKDMSNLPKEFLFEPKLGLEAGIDGLKLVLRILSYASDYLSDKGILICEVGNSMKSLIERHPNIAFTWIQFKNGGEGVFAITKQELINSKLSFNSH